MNVEIRHEFQNKEVTIPTVLEYFTDEKGILLAIIIIFLIAAETYYQNINGHSGVTYIGGGFTVSAIAVVMGWLTNAVRKKRKYVEKLDHISHNASILTTIFAEDYLERRIDKAWSQRFYWDMMERYIEDRRSFFIIFYGKEVLIRKSDISNQDTIIDIRNILKSKKPKGMNQSNIGHHQPPPPSDSTGKGGDDHPK